MLCELFGFEKLSDAFEIFLSDALRDQVGAPAHDQAFGAGRISDPLGSARFDQLLAERVDLVAAFGHLFSDDRTPDNSSHREKRRAPSRIA